MARVSRMFMGAALLLAGGAGCRALLDLPDIGGTELDAAVAVEAAPLPEVADTASPVPVDDAGPGNCGPYVPPEGDYAYTPASAASPGVEELYTLKDGGKAENAHFLNSPARIPPAGAATFRGRVTHQPNGGFVQRLDLNATHFDEFTFLPIKNGMQVVSVTESVFGVPVNASCNPPADLIRCPMVPNVETKTAASGSFKFFNETAEFTASVSFTYVDDGNDSKISVRNGDAGTVLVDCYHLLEKREFNGRIGKFQNNEYWFAKSNGLLLKSKLKAGKPASGVVDGLEMTPSLSLPLEYKIDVEFVLVNLVPTPLPAPPKDAGSKDAKTD